MATIECTWQSFVWCVGALPNIFLTDKSSILDKFYTCVACLSSIFNFKRRGRGGGGGGGERQYMKALSIHNWNFRWNILFQQQ